MQRLAIQLHKEFRALAPWWAGAAFTVVLAGVLSARQTDHEGTFTLGLTALFAHVAACAALGALSIGQEYSNRTLSSLFASPVDRRTLLAQKFVILAALVGILLAISYVTVWSLRLFPVYREPGATRLFVFGPALSGLFLAPWLTMVSRNVLAGAVFSIAIPLLVGATANAFDVGAGSIWNAYLILAAIGAVMTYVTFLRLPVLDGPQEVGGVTQLFEQPVARASSRSPGGWLGAAVRKELRLQYMTFAVSGLYVMVWALITISREVYPTLVDVGPTFFAITSLHGLFVAVLAGAVTSAEERHLGTAAWQLLLPVAAWKQFVVKITTALSTGLVLAIGVPAILKAIHAAHDDMSFDPEQLLGVAGLTVAGAYVSSLSSTGVRALLATPPLLVAAMLFAIGVLLPVSRMTQHALVGPVIFVTGERNSPATQYLVEGLLLSLMCGWLLSGIFFALRNHRWSKSGIRVLMPQLAWLALLAMVVLTVIILVQASGYGRMAIR